LLIVNNLQSTEGAFGPANPRRKQRPGFRARKAAFLRGDQRIEHPAHERGPLGIVASHHGSERLLRDQLGQDHESLRSARRLRPKRGKL